MRYFVITSDGQKYGPADVPLLSQWAREGRLSPTSMLEGEDGTQVVASQLPGLSFPETAAPMTPPVQSAPPPGGNPYAGYYDRGVMFDGTYNPSLFPKFNWGAFLLSWIWGLNHKKPVTLVVLALNIMGNVFGGGFSPRSGMTTSSPIGSLFSLVAFGVSIWIGMNGYKWAWESGRFRTPEECRKCQAIWGWWGLAIVVAFCICIGAAVGMAAMAIRAG